jgi:hypothetical protein
VNTQDLNRTVHINTTTIRIVDLVLVPDAQNPNKMSRERFEMLVAFIREGGFMQPILVARQPDNLTYEVVDGNHRVKALTVLGIEHVQAAVRDMSPDKRRAYRYAMNRLRGDVDMSLAQMDMVAMTAEFPLDELSLMTGFSVSELTDLTASHDTALLADAGAEEVPTDESPMPDKPFVLELPFATRKLLTLVKHKLRKAAGESKDMSLGLLNVLGEGDEVDGG